MTLADLSAVWTPYSGFFALLAGVLLGWPAGMLITNPQYSAGTATEKRIGFLVAVFTFSVGLMFFASQTLASYLYHDPLWFRAFSRFGPWILLSIAIGVTVGLIVRRDRKRRKLIAHERAVASMLEPHDQVYDRMGNH